MINGRDKMDTVLPLLLIFVIALLTKNNLLAAAAAIVFFLKLMRLTVFPIGSGQRHRGWTSPLDSCPAYPLRNGEVTLKELIHSIFSPLGMWQSWAVC